MAFLSNVFSKKKTFHHGIHPPEQKHFSADAAIEVVPTPPEILLPLQQNIGAPCEPLVKPKQEVVLGEVVGKSNALISAKLHASVSGTVQKFAVTTIPNGRHMQAILIKTDHQEVEGGILKEDMFGGEWPVDIEGNYDPADVNRAISEAGIVGLGGAAFPTHVKISKNGKNPVDTLLVNGCECEPFLTADDRLMREAPAPIITGTLLAALVIGAKEIVIGIESNKLEAIDSVRRASAGTGIKVSVLKTKYPQGSEKHLVKALTKRTIPIGGLPSDVGVAVSNVGTMAAVARAVIRKSPLTHRVLCVTGAGIAQPKNLLVPIGIRYREVVDYCGGLTDDAARIISGGPMMGFSFTDLDMPITKGTSGVTVLTHHDFNEEKRTACIRCGRCADVCPMRLVPSRLAIAARHRDMGLAKKYNITGCIECGCCGYICPANIHLIQLIRMGKAMTAAGIKLK